MNRSRIIPLVLWIGCWLAADSARLAAAGAAEGVPLEQVPPLPAQTVMAPETRRGPRGWIGAYAMKPSQAGAYEDETVWYAGPDGRRARHPSLAFRYRKQEGVPFCGTYLLVLGDLSGYRTMTFWIKGGRGGEMVAIGMNDTVSNRREDAVFAGPITRYLPGGVTTEWQPVVIPLEDFFGPDLSRVYSIVFSYNEEGDGMLWVDQVAFHPGLLVDREAAVKAQGYLLLDAFDHSDLNALGRKTGAYKRLPSVCVATRSPAAAASPGGQGLRLDYEKAAGGWCGYYTLLNQIDGEYFDVTPYKAVSFMVRGARGGETFEIGMADKNWLTIGDSVKAGPVERYLRRGVTASWQEVVVPLADFGKLDFTQMGSFAINFHKAGRGAVFVDDLLLVRKSDEEILQEWDD